MCCPQHTSLCLLQVLGFINCSYTVFPLQHQFSTYGSQPLWGLNISYLTYQMLALWLTAVAKLQLCCGKKNKFIGGRGVTTTWGAVLKCHSMRKAENHFSTVLLWLNRVLQFILLQYQLFSVCVYLLFCVCTPYMQCPQNPKEGQDPLELKVWSVVSFHAISKTPPWVHWKGCKYF